MNMRDELARLMKQLEEMTQDIDDEEKSATRKLTLASLKTYNHVVRSTMLTTVVAHKALKRLNALEGPVFVHMALWLMEYESAHGNPFEDLGAFLSRVVFETRDETERQLGVRKKEGAS